MFTNTTTHDELSAEHSLDIFTSKLAPFADIAVGLAIMSIGEFDILPYIYIYIEYTSLAFFYY